MEWIGIIVRGMFYGTCIAIMFPVLLLLKVDERSPGVEDGLDLGYNDNDPGEDVDE